MAGNDATRCVSLVKLEAQALRVDEKPLAQVEHHILVGARRELQEAINQGCRGQRREKIAADNQVKRREFAANGLR